MNTNEKASKTKKGANLITIPKTLLLSFQKPWSASNTAPNGVGVLFTIVHLMQQEKKVKISQFELSASTKLRGLPVSPRNENVSRFFLQFLVKCHIRPLLLCNLLQWDKVSTKRMFRRVAKVKNHQVPAPAKPQ